MAFIGCAALGVLGLVIVAVDAEARAVGLLCAAVFGGLALAGGFLPREITFGDDALTVRSRLRPDQRIAYRDILGFGLGRLKARGARLGWTQFENAGEVEDAFGDLLEAGRIRTEHLTDDMVTSDVIGIRASVIGMVALLAMGGVAVVAAFVAPPWVWSAPGWVYEVVIPLSVFGLATGIAYAVLRWQDRGRRSGG